MQTRNTCSHYRCKFVKNLKGNDDTGDPPSTVMSWTYVDGLMDRWDFQSLTSNCNPDFQAMGPEVLGNTLSTFGNCHTIYKPLYAHESYEADSNTTVHIHIEGFS